MTCLQFPHFTRKFSASLVFYGQNSLLWTGLTLLFLVNIYAKVNLTPSYEKELLQMLQKPFSSLAHETLAQNFWQQGLISAAQRELRLAQTLPKENNVSVLGASTEDELIAWTSEPALVKASYEYWKTVVSAKPDYRDAYISFAAAAYQLGFLDEAKTAAQTAMNLNLNNLETARLVEFFGKTK
jgi:tetratricopeptide (TPR) repeat protein